MRLTLVSAAALSVMAMTPADAATTMRYSFDIVGSVIDYENLEKHVDQEDYVEGEIYFVDDATYAGVVATYHPLAALVGLTGSTGFDVVSTPSGDLATVARSASGRHLVCNEFVFCPLLFSDSPNIVSYKDDLTDLNIDGGGVYVWFDFDGFAPGSDGGVFRYSNDSLAYGFERYLDANFWWDDPRAQFAISNARMEVLDDAVAVMPVPPGAALYGAGLLSLAWLRRRRPRRG